MRKRRVEKSPNITKNVRGFQKFITSSLSALYGLDRILYYKRIHKRYN